MTPQEYKKAKEDAKRIGAKIEYISTETEEGKQFFNITKGIGAILRWKIK